MKFNNPDIEPLLRKYLTGKEVLDVGCLNFTIKGFQFNPLHILIKEISSYCLGVDREKEILKLKGFNVVCSSIYDLNINRKFDVVFAGEFIEHLDNHHKFLEVVRKHLKLRGLLILTTVNPYFIGRNFQIWKENDYHVSKHHYCYFCPKTLRKLLEDNGFKFKALHWINHTPRARIGFIPIKMRPNFSSNFMIVATKNESA